MIQLTHKMTRKNKQGKDIDATMYLERLDNNNLVLKQGDRILAYYGDVKTALTRSLNYAIKDSDTQLNLENILNIVKSMDESIKQLTKDCIKKKDKNGK